MTMTDEEFKRIMGCTPQEWLNKKIEKDNIYKSNVEILPISNVEQLEILRKNLGYKKEELINNNFMKQYKDFNVNNYIICYIYVEFDNKPFDEKLYNEYHEEYLKYYSKNPNIKLIVWTNNFDWCKLNFKFFNTTIYLL